MNDDAPVTHTPAPKGKPLPKVKRISLKKWGADKRFTFETLVEDPPKMSASKKCYLFAMKQGESDIVVNIDGVDRKLRMTLILYAKIPATERRATMQEDALRAEQRGEPKLY